MEQESTPRYVSLRNGKHIPVFQMSYKPFIDRLTMLYGKSGTGKTSCMKEIVYTLREKIPVAIVVSGSERSNHTYEEFIKKAMIHDDFTHEVEGKNLIELIYEWQEMRASRYHQANNIKKLAILYNKSPSKETSTYIDSIEKKYKTLCSNTTPTSAMNKELEGERDSLLNRIYKNHINKYMKKYRNMELTPEETVILDFLNINPRLLLIVDDCASDLRKLSKLQAFQDIFHKGRHRFITGIISAQDDVNMDADLRKSATINIYTTANVASVNITRPNSGFDKYTKSFISTALPDIYVGHQKLLYMADQPEGKNFYAYTAKIPDPFMFGEIELNEMCSKVEKSEISLNKNNVFYKMFK